MKSKFSLLFLLFFAISIVNSAQNPVVESIKEVVKPLAIDKAVLSGIGLKPVTNPAEPNRKLFQRRMYRGNDISVYIVSSESATATRENYGIDEFIYLVNGRARMEDLKGNEQYFSTGDFFIAPKGFTGEWDTEGATLYHHELSVITTDRSKEEVDIDSALPLMVDKNKLSGIGITKLENEKEQELYEDLLFEGAELKLKINAEAPRTIQIVNPLPEQLIYVVSGSLQLTPINGIAQMFYAGDFLVLPENFVGEWKSDGHNLFRSMRVLKSNF